MTPLAGYDENQYVANTNANARNLQGYWLKWLLSWQSTLFKSFQKSN
jgi:hypothetical protein